MEPTEFTRGDYVRRISGGPVMVVDIVYPSFFSWRYACIWSDATGTHWDVFRRQQLESASPEQAALVLSEAR